MEALDSGQAAERFARLVSLQGGPSDLLDRPGRYLRAAAAQAVAVAPTSGFISGIQTRALGRLVGSLGGGRVRADQVINPAVGLSGLPCLGQQFEAGEALATVHAASDEDANRGVQIMLDALKFEEQAPVDLPPTIHRRLLSG